MIKIIDNIFSTKSGLSHQGILISATGAFIALLIVILVSQLFVSGTALPFLVASMGASAVILFAIPSSPMARPWPVLGGQIISALTGVFCHQVIDDVLWGVPITIALSITLMLYLRCLHPPGGATSLIAVAGGSEIYELGYQFVLTPVMINSIIILITGFLFKAMLTKSLVHKHSADDDEWWSTVPSHRTGLRVPFHRSDLCSAMQQLDTYVDITKSDLLRIYSMAALHANTRNYDECVCEEVMIRRVYKVEYATELNDVWTMLRENNIRSVPVVDRVNHLVGIVTVSDFIRHANEMGEGDEKTRLKRLVKHTEGMTSNKPEVAGQIMTESVFSLGPDDTLVTARKLLNAKCIHHLPIVNKDNKLIGIISHTDLPDTMTCSSA